MPQEAPPTEAPPVNTPPATPPVETPPATPPAAWYESLDADLRSHPSIQKFNEPAKLAKSYLELEKMVGKEKVVVPTDKSTPDEWNAFYKRMGRPDEMTGYKTPNLEVDDNIRMQPRVEEAFRKKAHELGLNEKQYAELYSFYHETGTQSLNAMLESQTEVKARVEADLRTEWGAAYDPRVDAAQKAINTFFTGRIEKSNEMAFNVLANSKGFIQAMSEIGAKLGEDSLAGDAKHTLTPDQAMTELNSIIMDSKHPYHDNTHPEHQASIDKVLSLQQLASNAS